jgi:hypothetical protein
MGNYGGNVVAAMTQGRLIYVDEPAAEDQELTPFDEAAVSTVDSFLAAWGVDGIYQPGVLNRAIRAIPKYVTDDAVVAGGAQRLRSPKLQIKVPNTAVNGITPAEFAPNQTVSVPPRKGADARQFQLARIVAQSSAWVTFELH